MKRIVLFAFLTFLLCEGFARLYLRDATLPYVTLPNAELAGKQYGQGTWWSEDYVKAMDRRFHSSEPRVVLGSPRAYRHSLYLVGNSALINNEVPDEYTIANLLQTRLQDWRVVNLSENGLNVQALTERLINQPLEAGDVVLFYNGAMESYRVWWAADADRGSRLTDGTCNLVLRTPLALFRLLCWQTQFDAPGLHDDRLFGYARDVAAAYDRSVQTARVYVEAHGARFINVLQPYCTCTTLNEYAGVGRAFMAFYDQARAISTDTLDWSHLVPEQDFFSTPHTTPEGSEIVARAIRTVLFAP